MVTRTNEELQVLALKVLGVSGIKAALPVAVRIRVRSSYKDPGKEFQEEVMVLYRTPETRTLLGVLRFGTTVEHIFNEEAKGMLSALNSGGSVDCTARVWGNNFPADLMIAPIQRTPRRFPSKPRKHPEISKGVARQV